MAKLRQVIEAEEHIGTGTEQDPYRIVTRFYDLDGTLLWTASDRVADLIAAADEARTYMKGETIRIPLPRTSQNQWGP